MTYGHGLSREHSLGRLFSDIGGYDVIDKSRNGKSNISIALDTYKHVNECDVFVLGFTYASRFGLEYNSENLDFFSGFEGVRVDRFNNEELENEFLSVYKFFYLTFGSPYCDQLSDMLIDYTVAFLKSKGKKVFAFSWEERTTNIVLDYPFYGKKDRLNDGHLSKTGTLKLFNRIQEQLGAE
jgi:hypothetical protein